MGAAYAQLLACTITTRFAAVKQTFGRPLIGHEHYRMRLSAAVGRSLAARHAMTALAEVAVARSAEGAPARDQVLHALISCGKSGCTGDARQTLAETRELCGGLGYHDANQIAPLLHDYEIAVTFGGDNTVLGYQATRFALRHREDFDRVLDEAVAGAGRLDAVRVLRAVCDVLLDRVERDGAGEASAQWSRAVHQTLAIGHWARQASTRCPSGCSRSTRRSACWNTRWPPCGPGSSTRTPSWGSRRPGTRRRAPPSTPTRCCANWPCPRA